MKFTETSIPNNYSMNIRNDARMDITPDDVEMLYNVLFASFSEFLAQVKKKDKTIALVMEDLKGNFLMAGIINYTENENKDMPGNWTYEMTFDADDIKNVDVTYKTTDTQYEVVVANTAYRVSSIRFASPTYVHDIIITAVKTLQKYLDENASETETKEVELPGYFTATVTVKNGKKKMAITPGDAMKRLIKDDAGL